MESVDEILALRPTLVIGSVPYKQETVAKLLEQPLNFLAKNPRSLADIERDILLLRANCRPHFRGSKRLVARMRSEFAFAPPQNREAEAAPARLLRSVAESADQFPALGFGNWWRSRAERWSFPPAKK